MPRPIRATFDLAAFARNLAVARARAGAARIWAVAKANGYGHGLLRAQRALDAADGFALLDIDAAVRLRDAGVRKPILLLEGFFAPADLAPIAFHSLSVVVHSNEQMAILESTRPIPPVAVYLKINTGMNRLGIPVDQIGAALARLTATGSVAGITLMTHFADADGSEGVAAQLARFEAATRGLALPRSLANSAALLRHPQTRADWVRPGIMLYGCSPFADEPAQALGLAPVMTLASELIAVRLLAAGERVGYGGTFTADRPMRDRRGGVRLRRRLPAARADRDADPGRGTSHADRGPRLDGHARRGSRRNSRGGARDTGHALGRRAVVRRGGSGRGNRELRVAVRARRAGTSDGAHLGRI